MAAFIKNSRVTIDQWRMLRAVVDCGGYAAAAEKLNKSQSTISYALQRLQDELGLKLLEIKGRKAVITTQGETLLRGARRLIDNADELESIAATLTEGWESEITLLKDIVCPNQLVITCLEEFELEHPKLRLEIIEASLSGTQESIMQGLCDVAISGQPPIGFLGEKLMNVEMLAVAHYTHPLIQLGREIFETDLTNHRQIVVRDSGSRRRLDAGWLEADKRWTVSSFNTSVELLRKGLGFAWVPLDWINDYLETGELHRLPLDQSASRFISINLVLPKRDKTGPAAKQLAALLRKHASSL